MELHNKYDIKPHEIELIMLIMLGKLPEELAATGLADRTRAEELYWVVENTDIPNHITSELPWN